MKNTFQGQYVKDVLVAITASMVSGRPLMLIGKPGCGKTVISMTALTKVWGRDKFVITRINATTPPERVKGVLDVNRFINNGEYVLNTDGTPYQTGIKATIADELGRAPDHIFDEYMFITDNLDDNLADRLVVIATSNFMPDNERIEALVDRFAIWMHINPGKPDIKAVSAHLLSAGKPEIDNTLPDADRIDRARRAIPDEPTAKLVQDFVETLRNEAERGTRAPDGSVLTFPVNYRRLTQWSDIVYRMAAMIHDTPTFTTIPNEARIALSWAWPGLTEERAQAWREVVSAVCDPIGASIDTLKTTVLNKFKEIGEKNLKPSQVSTELASVLADGEEELRNLAMQMGIDYEEDEIIQETLGEMNRAMANYILGNNPF